MQVSSWTGYLVSIRNGDNAKKVFLRNYQSSFPKLYTLPTPVITTMMSGILCAAIA